MAATARPRLRTQLIVYAVAGVIALVGAVVWSQTIAGGDDPPVDAQLDVPGEYLEPSGDTNPPLPTDRLPSVELVTADGSPATLVPTGGRPMVVNLWYSTCAPCARELADFAAVHDDVGAAVRFVGVNPFDTPDAMLRFAADRGVTYELLRDPEFALSDELGVAAYPVTVFVDADGSIRERTGVLDSDALRDRIDRYWG